MTIAVGTAVIVGVVIYAAVAEICDRIDAARARETIPPRDMRR